MALAYRSAFSAEMPSKVWSRAANPGMSTFMVSLLPSTGDTGNRKGVQP
jgi:hypothetical protein